MTSQKISGEKFGDETEFSDTLSFWDEQVCVWHVKPLACEIFGSRTWKIERENKDLWATGHSTLITVERALRAFHQFRKMRVARFPDFSFSLFFQLIFRRRNYSHKAKRKTDRKSATIQGGSFNHDRVFLVPPCTFYGVREPISPQKKKKKKLVAFIFQSLSLLLITHSDLNWLMAPKLR